MILLRIQIVLCWIVALLESSEAWNIVGPGWARPRKFAKTDGAAPAASARTTASSALLLLHMTHNPPPDNNSSDDDEDGDCSGSGESEECEIDWDTMMPPTDHHHDPTSPQAPLQQSLESMKEQLERQFAASSSSSSSSTSATTAAAAAATMIPSVERYGDSSKTVTTTTLRHRLEMQWHVTEHLHDDECDVYQPASCGGLACTTCQGRGHCACRFCQGARHLLLQTRHDDGTVETDTVACQICSASGQEACRSCQGTGWVADWTGIGGGVHVGGSGNSNGLLP